MKTEGLSLDQAPPLAIPMSFFLAAPCVLMAAGVLLLILGAEALTTHWALPTLVLTHLGTLGFLGMVMLGALYQMTPVVAGARVPFVRLGHAVNVLLIVAVGSLSWAGAVASSSALVLGFRLAGLALALFLVPVGMALFRTSVRSDTVRGMRLAWVALVLVLALGLVMAEGHAGGSPIADRLLAIRVHLSLAFLCWVGGLMSAVSWQVVPMFYLCEEPGPVHRRVILAGVLLGLLLLPSVLFLQGAERSRDLAVLAAAPAALAVWVWHPWTTLRAMLTRKRRRPEASLLFWKAGLACAPLTLGAGLLAHFSDDARFTMLFGWMAIWGWAGLIVHGMLHRIVPFLAWFHLLSPLIGEVVVPSARSLLPDERTRFGLVLHLLSLIVGAVAILLRSDRLASGAGLLLVAVGLHQLLAFSSALRAARGPGP